MSTSLTKTSRYLALILRHKPEIAGITLDGQGWARVDELLASLGESHGLTREQLERIVATDGKQRYAFNEDHTLIRANQGHSIPVDVGLEERKPPATLFHGTAERFAASIERKGLLPMGRLYVHLSPDVATARTVGTRHGKPLVYAVDCRGMRADGHRFWLSENRVWLTEQVPPRYLHRLEDPARDDRA